MDYAKINEAAMGYKDDMTKFLRDLVRIPGESCGEKGHIMAFTVILNIFNCYEFKIPLSGKFP